jgi:cell division protein FtsI (penicillin-binding protein 3)
VSATSSRRGVDVIDRRVGLVFGLFLLLLAAGLARAAYLGVFRSGALKAAAATEHVDNVKLPPVRGTITDRNHTVLALSESADQIIGDPLLIQNPTPGTKAVSPQTIANQLAPIIHVPAARLLTELTEPNVGYVPLATVPQAAAAKVAAMQLKGQLTAVYSVPVQKQVYPLQSEASQVLGWAGATRAASGGLEYLDWNLLAGSGGIRRIVNAANDQAVSVTTVKPMIPGKSLQLTLDAPLQAEVEHVLAGVGAQYHPTGATAIVMNPNNNQILALANWPTFNPNKPIKQSQLAATQDQAVGLSYEPGSTFKAITVAGALQDGLITPQTTFTIPPYLRYYNRVIRDAEAHGTEDLTVAQILQVSSNIGADLIGRRLGATRFNYWVHRFGFGKYTHIDLPGEQLGIVPTLGQYSGVTMATLPFGQGLEVTPIQLATAYSAIANGGILRRPQVVESVAGKPVKEPKGVRILSPNVASEVRVMLRGVLADDGTASGAAIPGYDLAGKTGTANVVVNGKYSKTDYMASFVGMVPASDPKLVVAVVVNYPKNEHYGGSVAAPAFQKIVGWAVPYFGINPCPSPCPASAMQGATPSTP